MDAWIVTETDQLSARIRESLLHLGIECPTTRVSSIESIESHKELITGFVGIVFFAARQLPSAYIEVLRHIRSVTDNDTIIVAISSSHDHGTVLNAIRAGAKDFLSAGDDLHQDLVGFITRTRTERKQKQICGRVVSIVPCHAPSDASLLSINIATVVAQRLGSCGLLDFQLRGGDLALLLKLSPRHTIVDLLNQQTNIDEAMFQQALTSHESGVRLLAGPNAFVDLKSVRPQICQQIITLAQRSHPIVIINSEDAQHAEQVRALAGSNEIVLTMRLDVVSLFRAKQHIEFMTHNRVLREHIHVVAVGTGYAGELPVTAVKKVLSISALHCIPDDPVSTIRAVNVGNPLVLEMPRTKISQAIVAFTNALIGQTEDTAMVASPPQLGAMKAAAVIALNTLPFCK